MNPSANISPASERRASEELGLWEPKRALTLEAARAHTLRIKFLRFVLMSISASLVAVLLWQFLSDRPVRDWHSDPTESIKMVEPRYSGRTSDGLPFFLVADTAIRRMKESDMVLLEKPILKFNREENVASSAVIATKGEFNDIDKILNLREDVNLETDDGNICDTHHARIFNVQKRIEGDEAIKCLGEFGTVNGKSYAIEDAYKTFIFKGGMTALLKQSGDASDKETAFGPSGDGPINVMADTGVYQGDRTDLRGNVRVVQDSAVITSDNMDIFRVNKNQDSAAASLKLGAIRRIVATGNFRYQSPENDIRGAKAVYVRDDNIMTVTGNVTVRQSGGNKVTAEKLTYNTKTGTIRFSGKCLGRNCEGSSGRIRTIISGSDKN